MTRVFGLTGGVASGKSTVAARLAQLGVPVIDADGLAREVTAPGSPALAEIAAAFGSEMLSADGHLERRKLGRLVFNDPAARARLDAIVHPRVAQRFAECVAELTANGVPLACYDVPLLFERQLEDRLRPVVVVSAPADLQLGRLMAKTGLPANEALARIASQIPLADKVGRADFVIDNSGSLEHTQQQVDAALQKIRAQLASSE